MDGHARANRHKPSGIASTESILRWHLVPALGAKRLDAITNEQVQRLKLALSHRAPKTVNTVLTVLSTLLKKAVEWGEVERVPCVIKAVRGAQRIAGIEQGVHILRHTFCSHLAMKGAPARGIQELAGHADLSTTRRYMHLSPAATEDAIRRSTGGNLASHSRKNLETFWTRLQRGSEWLRFAFRLRGDAATADKSRFAATAESSPLRRLQENWSHANGATVALRAMVPKAGHGAPASERVGGLGAKPPDQDWIAGYGNRNRLISFSKLVMARDFW